MLIKQPKYKDFLKALIRLHLVCVESAIDSEYLPTVIVQTWTFGDLLHKLAEDLYGPEARRDCSRFLKRMLEDIEGEINLDEVSPSLQQDWVIVTDMLKEIESGNGVG